MKLLKIYITLSIIAAAFYYSGWGIYKALTDHDTTRNVELQAEIGRLEMYEDLFNDHNLTLTYNGCEDMRERLGL